MRGEISLTGISPPLDVNVPLSTSTVAGPMVAISLNVRPTSAINRISSLSLESVAELISRSTVAASRSTRGVAEKGG